MGLTEASAFKDNTIIDDDVKSDASIQGTKIVPNFGSQNILTTGTLGSSDITITDSHPRISFMDAEARDYDIYVDSGTWNIRDLTASNATRFQIASDGHVNILQRLDALGGVAVSGNLTVSNNVSITGDLNLPNQGQGLVPVGTVITFAGSSAPAGYLKANGDSIPNGSGTVQSITADFSALYAIVGANLPDLRGEFVRGWASDTNDSTRDQGRGIRSGQSDDITSHNHSASSTSSVTDPGHKHNLNFNMGSIISSGGAFGLKDSGNADRMFTATTGISVSTSTTIGNTGGSETRPRNVALMYIIKF